MRLEFLVEERDRVQVSPLQERSTSGKIPRKASKPDFELFEPAVRTGLSQGS